VALYSITNRLWIPAVYFPQTLYTDRNRVTSQQRRLYVHVNCFRLADQQHRAEDTRQQRRYTVCITHAG